MPRKIRRTKPAGKIPVCPECGSSDIVPVVHGLITPSVQRSIDQGTAIRANREEWEGMTEWYCKTCGCDWSGEWRRFKKPGTIT